MGPKKDTKKQAVSKPDNSGIPKNDVELKFEISVRLSTSQQPAPNTYAVMFEWFGATSDKRERSDSTFMDSWVKKQEKENPNSDTVVQWATFEKAMDPIRVDDDFCKTLSNTRFFLYVVDQDSKIRFEVLLDYSSILMWKATDQLTYTYINDKLPVPEIECLRLTLTSNKELLTDVYRHYLNPMEIEVIGAKDVPDSISKDYLPAYVKYQFFDGSTVNTNGVVSRGKLIWGHKHVFLVGLMDPASIKQKLRSQYLRFELHDRDELVKNAIKQDVGLVDVGKIIQEEAEKEKPIEDDPKKKGSKKQTKKQTKQQKKDIKKQPPKKDAKKKDAKLGQPVRQNKKPAETISTNYGVAAYFLVDFMQPNNRHFKLKSPVVPRKTFEDLESKNIDLNTTARTEMQKVISSNNYFENDTMLIVGFTLSYAIGTFTKPQIKQQQQQPVDDKNKKVAKTPATTTQAATQEPVQARPATAPKPKDVYQRVVYVLPYKSPDLIKTIQETFYSINLRAMKLGPNGHKELGTILLTPAQKVDPQLDVVTGIQILDNEFRMYILEGLRNGGIAQFNSKIVKDTPNTKTMKILKNSTLTFTQRLYADFNLDIKRIRLRPNLTELLLQPSIYIKSKVPEEICATLNHISDVKKIADNLKTVDSMNMWPQAKWLIQVERKFSDSLTFQDIQGIEQTKKIKEGANTSRNATLQQPSILKTMNSNGTTTLPRLSTIKQQTMKTIPDSMHLKAHASSLSRTYQHTGFNKQEPYTLHVKPSTPTNEPVYSYASQKNNTYEKQMHQLRQKIAQDKNHVYTYGLNHLSLSIAPHTQEEVKKLEQEKEKALMAGKVPFHHVLIKTKEQRMKLPLRPTDEDIEVLKKHPYHQQKARQVAILKNHRGDPVSDPTREEFKSYIGRINIFSENEITEAEKVSPVEKQRLERELKKAHKQAEKKLLKGDETIHIKKGYYSDKAAQLDKYKEILEGDAKKQGLLLPQKKIKDATVTMTKAVGNSGVSAFIHDEFDKSFNPLVRVDNLQLSVGATNFHNFQNPQYLSKSGVTKPLRHNPIL